MKKYRLTEKAKDRYMMLAWIAVLILGGLANTYIGL